MAAETKPKVRAKAVAASKIPPRGGHYVTRDSASGRILAGDALRQDMQAYARETTASKAKARAFLRRIGAPVKA